MWKELQTGAPENVQAPSTDNKSAKAPSLLSAAEAPSSEKPSAKGPSLLQAAETLPKMPLETDSAAGQPDARGDGAQDEGRAVTLDSLFTQASKVKAEEDQFVAMFKSLQISADKEKGDNSATEVRISAQNHLAVCLEG